MNWRARPWHPGIKEHKSPCPWQKRKGEFLCKWVKRESGFDSLYWALIQYFFAWSNPITSPLLTKKIIICTVYGVFCILYCFFLCCKLHCFVTKSLTIYAFLREEKFRQKLYKWRKNDKYEVIWVFLSLHFLHFPVSNNAQEQSVVSGLQHCWYTLHAEKFSPMQWKHWCR